MGNFSIKQLLWFWQVSNLRVLLLDSQVCHHLTHSDLVTEGEKITYLIQETWKPQPQTRDPAIFKKEETSKCCSLFARSDMQRDRARERHERARRQWELEHAEIPMTSTTSAMQPMTSSASNGGMSLATNMNHIGETSMDGMTSFSLVSFFEIRKTLFRIVEHRGSILASHPTAPGSNPSIPKKIINLVEVNHWCRVN